MLGVCVVIIAVVASIGGAWALSMDMEEVQVTKYNYVADITGVFDSNKAVQFIEYEPSTNFTGYYTNTTTKYFDGVDYSTSSKANNYKLNLAPLNTTNSTVTLTTLTSETVAPPSVPDWNVRYANTDSTTVVCYANQVSFSSFITQKNLGSYDVVKVSANVTTVDYTSASGGWFTFATKSMKTSATIIEDGHYNFKNPSVTSADKESWSVPILSAIYDGTAVELFYNPDFTNSAGVYTASEVVLLYYRSSSYTGTLTLSDTAKLYAVEMPDVTYMDVSRGVSCES